MLEKSKNVFMSNLHWLLMVFFSLFINNAKSHLIISALIILFIFTVFWLDRRFQLGRLKINQKHLKFLNIKNFLFIWCIFCFTIGIYAKNEILVNIYLVVMISMIISILIDCYVERKNKI
ncbi:hypothetical protein [Apilactobacillus ozensis]|uniref:hypothetical protein n=1 Tax=Apilactobacillus ozensis TaxID=866801 RepID=UPI000704BB2C|nr:hypothetical protein [Apilactobacillus ozensis]